MPLALAIAVAAMLFLTPMLWNGRPLIRNGRPALGPDCCCSEEPELVDTVCGDCQFPAELTVTIADGCLGAHTFTITYDPDQSGWVGWKDYDADRFLLVILECAPDMFGRTWHSILYLTTSVDPDDLEDPCWGGAITSVPTNWCDEQPINESFSAEMQAFPGDDCDGCEGETIEWTVTE
jgi:hypothetical protein